MLRSGVGTSSAQKGVANGAISRGQRDTSQCSGRWAAATSGKSVAVTTAVMPDHSRPDLNALVTKLNNALFSPVSVVSWEEPCLRDHAKSSYCLWTPRGTTPE